MRINLSFISKYRAELMGIAILGVMLAHIKTICEFPDTMWNKLLGVFCYSIYTGGLFFLSGLGLFASYDNNPNLGSFYSKRIKRVVIPYITISLPYFIYTDLISNNNIGGFCCHITTASYWISGNYSGMWYIAVILALYLIYPFLHKLLYSSQRNVDIKALLYIVLSTGLLVVINKLSNNYLDRIELTPAIVAVFVAGSYCMYLIVQEKNVLSITKILISGGVIILCYILAQGSIWLAINILSIILFSYCMDVLYRYKIGELMGVALKWFGTYSLELYIIHLLVYNLLNTIDTALGQGVHICIGVFVALVLCMPIHNGIKTIMERILKF